MVDTTVSNRVTPFLDQSFNRTEVGEHEQSQDQLVFARPTTGLFSAVMQPKAPSVQLPSKESNSDENPEKWERDVLIGVKISETTKKLASFRAGHEERTIESAEEFQTNPSKSFGTFLNFLGKEQNTQFGLPPLKRRKIGQRSALSDFTIADEDDFYTLNPKKHRWIIGRFSVRRAMFDTMMDLLIAFSVCSSLYFLGFHGVPDGPLFIIDQVVRIFFVLEMGLNFMTEITDDHDKPISSFRLIAKNYLLGWFIPDLIAVFPIGVIVGNWDVEYFCRMVRIIKLPNALNMLDGRGLSLLIVLVRSEGSRDENQAVSFLMRYIGQLMMLMVNMVLLCYTCACFWFWYVKQTDDLKYSDTDFIEANVKLEDESESRQFLRTLYFILTTVSTVGYGDYLPKNTSEYAVVALIMLTGVAFFAYVMGLFNTTIAEYDELTSGDDELSSLNIWMDQLERIQRKLSPAMKRGIIDHFTYYWANDRLRFMAKKYWKEPSSELVSLNMPYLEDLPEEIALSILNYLWEDVFYNFRRFFGPSDFKYYLSFHFQPRLFQEGEVIIEQGEKCQEIYMIMSGVVAMGPIKDGVQMVVCTWANGRTVLGEYSVLTSRPALTSYKALETVQAFAIPNRPFLQLLETFFPQVKIEILAAASQRNSQMKQVLSEKIKAKNKVEPEKQAAEDTGPTRTVTENLSPSKFEQEENAPVQWRRNFDKVVKDIGNFDLLLGNIRQHHKGFKHSRKKTLSNFKQNILSKCRDYFV